MPKSAHSFEGATVEDHAAMKKQWQTNLEIDLLKSAWIRKDREQHGAHAAPPLSAAKHRRFRSKRAARRSSGGDDQIVANPLLRDFSAFAVTCRDMKGRPFAPRGGVSKDCHRRRIKFTCVATRALCQRQSVLAAITMAAAQAADVEGNKMTRMAMWLLYIVP
ncbi:uncharacterized protein PITG_21851, partial [Phytophthora infestans T30-4]